MSEATYTPGPWDLQEVRTSIGRAFRIGSGDMLTAGPGCCIVYDDYPGNLDNQRAANARLISAAPDLLEALKGLVEFADKVTGRAEPEYHQLARARAAIAKAQPSETASGKER